MVMIRFLVTPVELHSLSLRPYPRHPPHPAEEEGEEGGEAGEHPPEQGRRCCVHEARGAEAGRAEGGEEEPDQQEEEHAQVAEGGGFRLSPRIEHRG